MIFYHSKKEVMNTVPYCVMELQYMIWGDWNFFFLHTYFTNSLNFFICIYNVF